MSPPTVRSVELMDVGDNRGSSFALPETWLTFLGGVRDLHITTLLPGHVRGNHYHAAHREVLIVLCQDRWSLLWDQGPGTDISQQNFSGAGAVLIEVDPGASHAIRNDGRVSLQIIGLANILFDPDAPDTIIRPVS